MRHPHDAARRQERTAPDPREVSGIDGINAEADAKQQPMKRTHPQADEPKSVIEAVKQHGVSAFRAVGENYDNDD